MNISLDKIRLSFGDKLILDELSYHIPQGSKVAIVGDSGRGKSSLINVLLGFVDVQGGRIIVDGSAILTSDFVKFRKQVAWLPQDLSLQIDRAKELLLFPFTFAQNKHLKPTDDEIATLLHLFRLDDAILEKQTSKISGGEKQRLMLISCALLQKSLVLFDEPSSTLDKRSKKIVTDYFMSLEDTTIIAATHDSYWIEQSDMILNLDPSKV